jgi:hemerythrin-like metal-binding protein
MRTAAMKQTHGKLSWNNKYKINIPTLDAQHKQLFNTYADLNQALKEGLRPSVIKDTLDRLHMYVSRHFTMEEKYMRESAYPGIDQQREAHKYFSAVFTEILEEFNSGGLTPGIVKKIQNELGHWLTNHVSELDMEFGRFYSTKNKD